jgi:hypothetical protein
MSRKPEDPHGRKKVFNVRLSPTEEVYCLSIAPTVPAALRLMVKTFLSAATRVRVSPEPDTRPTVTAPPERQPVETATEAKQPDAVRTPRKVELCERCTRFGVPSCDACRKKALE